MFFSNPLRSICFLILIISWSHGIFAKPKAVQHPFIGLKVEDDVFQEQLTGEPFEKAAEQMKEYMEYLAPNVLPQAIRSHAASFLPQRIDFAPPLLRLSKGGVEGWVVFGNQSSPVVVRNLYLWKFFQSPKTIEHPHEYGQYLLIRQIKGPGKSLGVMILKGHKGGVDGLDGSEWLSVIESFAARLFNYDDLKNAAQHGALGNKP